MKETEMAVSIAHLCEMTKVYRSQAQRLLGRPMCTAAAIFLAGEATSGAGESTYSTHAMQEQGRLTKKHYNIVQVTRS
jgi:hypothetical protein